MKGCGTGDNGRIASLMRSAAAPVANTDSPRLRANWPKDRSTPGSHVIPIFGQQAATATEIKAPPVSTIRNAPPDPAESGAVIMGSISGVPRSGQLVYVEILVLTLVKALLIEAATPAML